MTLAMTTNNQRSAAGVAEISFPSLMFGDKIGYLIMNRNDCDSRYGEKWIHPLTRMFKVNSDKSKQHGTQEPIPVKYFGDWCLSLAVFCQDEPPLQPHSALSILAEFWPNKLNAAFDRSRVMKAACIRYDAGKDGNLWKPQYINFDELRVSKVTSKQYDTRWTQLGSYANGSAQGVFKLLNLKDFELCGLEVFARYSLILEVLNDMDESENVPHAVTSICGEFLPGDLDPERAMQSMDVQNAFRALQFLVIAEQSRRNAQLTIGNLKSKLESHLERVMVRAAIKKAEDYEAKVSEESESLAVSV